MGVLEMMCFLYQTHAPQLFGHMWPFATHMQERTSHNAMGPFLAFKCFIPQFNNVNYAIFFLHEFIFFAHGCYVFKMCMI